jgi:hypothetical protein
MPSTLQEACQTKKAFVFSRQRFFGVNILAYPATSW